MARFSVYSPGIEPGKSSTRKSRGGSARADRRLRHRQGRGASKTGEPAFLAIIQSHSPTEERIADLKQQIQQSGSVPTSTGAEAYQAMLAQMG